MPSAGCVAQPLGLSPDPARDRARLWPGGSLRAVSCAAVVSRSGRGFTQNHMRFSRGNAIRGRTVDATGCLASHPGERRLTSSVTTWQVNPIGGQMKSSPDGQVVGIPGLGRAHLCQNHQPNRFWINLNAPQVLPSAHGYCEAAILRRKRPCVGAAILSVCLEPPQLQFATGV